MALLFYYDPATLKGVSVMNFSGSPLPPVVPEQPYSDITGLGLNITDPSQWSISPEGVVSKTGRPVRDDEVDEERDRRIVAGFAFQGHVFQFDEVSKGRITGAATLAGFAALNGSLAGDYRWRDANHDFAFLDKDNGYLVMDAATCLAFGKAAANHDSDHVFAARALKTAAPIPVNYQDDSHWPPLQGG